MKLIGLEFEGYGILLNSHFFEVWISWKLILIISVAVTILRVRKVLKDKRKKK